MLNVDDVDDVDVDVDDDDDGDDVDAVGGDDDVDEVEQTLGCRHWSTDFGAQKSGHRHRGTEIKAQTSRRRHDQLSRREAGLCPGFAWLCLASLGAVLGSLPVSAAVL